MSWNSPADNQPSFKIRQAVASGMAKREWRVCLHGALDLGDRQQFLGKLEVCGYHSGAFTADADAAAAFPALHRSVVRYKSAFRRTDSGIRRQKQPRGTTHRKRDVLQISTTGIWNKHLLSLSRRPITAGRVGLLTRIHTCGEKHPPPHSTVAHTFAQTPSSSCPSP